MQKFWRLQGLDLGMERLVNLPVMKGQQPEQEMISVRPDQGLDFGPEELEWVAE